MVRSWRPEAAVLLVLAMASMALPRGAAAQDPGLVWGLGVGPGAVQLSVAGEVETAYGVVPHGRLGMRTAGGTLFLAELDLQPFDVENPRRAEAFRGAWWLASVEFTLADVLVRPSLGWQHRSWSGANPVEDSDGGPALGLAAGYELGRRGPIAVTVEAFGRVSSIELEGSVGARLLGIRVVGSVYPGGP